MARMARLKVQGKSAWYHLCARTGGYQEEYPFAEPLVARKLVEFIEHYCGIYFCSPAAFCIMGNHYHLVTWFDAPREVAMEELQRRADRMYPSRKAKKQVALWNDEQWEKFRRRLFDVSELMRNVQSGFARWYNDTFERRGRLWADRFNSVILGDMAAVLDCMLYIELNPVRAGLVQRPEEWQECSLFQREIGTADWLLPLQQICSPETEQEALIEYRERIYYRGSVPTKPGQAALSLEVLEQEIARGFEVSGVYRRRLRYFVGGLMIGSEELIRDQLLRLRESGRYLRRKNPISHLNGLHLSLREQRSTAAVF